MDERESSALAEKLLRFKFGEMDDVEIQQLNEQAAADPQLLAILKDISDQTRLENDLRDLNQFDAGKAYLAALKAVDKENKPQGKTLTFWYKFAAACFLTITSVGLVLYNWLNKDSEEIEVIITQQEQSDNMGVRLVLANGQQVNVDSVLELNAGGANFSSNQGALEIAASQTTTPPTSTDNLEAGTAAFHKIVVPYKQTYKVTMPDGSRVHLNAGSTLSFPANFGAKERLVHLDGEAFFEVAPSIDRHFVVQSGNQQIRVYGTSFNVKAYNDEAHHYTTLQEGKLSVRSSSDQPETFIQPGHRASINKATGKLAVEEVELSSIGNWKDGWLTFENMPMQEILQQIGRWYNLDVALSNTEIGSIKASGKIQFYDDVNDVLRKFEMLGDIRFELTNNRLLARRGSGSVKN